jgi:hypothetical protein
MPALKFTLAFLNEIGCLSAHFLIMEWFSMNVVRKEFVAAKLTLGGDVTGLHNLFV